MSNPTPAQYNKTIPLEEKQRMVAHELGHFYQAHRLLGINSDVTFGYHYADPDDPAATRALIRTSDGRAIVQSRTHGEAFNQKLQELALSGSIDFYTARRYWGCRLLGGGEMEKALYGGESVGDSDDVQLVQARLSEMWLEKSDQRALENDLRAEVQQSLTPDVLKTIKRTIAIVVREHFTGERTSGDVIEKIFKGDVI